MSVTLLIAGGYAAVPEEVLAGSVARSDTHKKFYATKSQTTLRRNTRHVVGCFRGDSGTRSPQPSGPGALNVLALTIFVGFVLVGFFVLLWLAQACGRSAFNERDALLPLEKESPRAADGSDLTRISES